MLPFNAKQFRKPLNEYEVWHHGRLIGRTQAVSEEQAVNNVLYRLGLIGYMTRIEMEAVRAVLVA
jgi:hypothetical protein